MKSLYYVTLPKYMDEKVGLLSVRTPDGSILHQSWKINNERIIVFESNQEDYPASALLLFNDLEEYINEIRRVSWINNREFVVNYSDELIELGFPYFY